MSTRTETVVSIRAQSPMPGPDHIPPLPPDVVPPPLDTPAEIPPEIREPELPGEHAPISATGRVFQPHRQQGRQCSSQRCRVQLAP